LKTNQTILTYQKKPAFAGFLLNNIVRKKVYQKG